MKKELFWSYIICSALLLTAAGCAKEDYKIGNGEPEKEVQKCMKLSEKKKFEEAVECFEIFKTRFPRSQYATEAELTIADNYFNNKEYLLAADAYSLFLKMHPTHPKTDYAYYKLGYSYLKESPKAIDRDQQYLDEAVQYLTIAVNSFPDGTYHGAAVDALKDARSRLAKRMFYIGRFYYKKGQYKAAIPRFLDLVNDYPDDVLVPEALYKMVVASCKIRMMDEAKLFFSKLAVEHPGNEWTKKAESEILSYAEKWHYTGGSEAAGTETEGTGGKQ